jgi:hypothetical protein
MDTGSQPAVWDLDACSLSTHNVRIQRLVASGRTSGGPFEKPFSDSGAKN